MFCIIHRLFCSFFLSCEMKLTQIFLPSDMKRRRTCKLTNYRWQKGRGWVSQRSLIVNPPIMPIRSVPSSLPSLAAPAVSLGGSRERAELKVKSLQTRGIIKPYSYPFYHKEIICKIISWTYLKCCNTFKDPQYVCFIEAQKWMCQFEISLPQQLMH